MNNFQRKKKTIIYQVLPRLFGNTKTANIQGGTLVENGVGKLSAFTPKVLREIEKMGVTHVWYTGLMEHASRTAYPEYNIPGDHPSIVKGAAGSPYAIRDYYDICPDLADNVPLRMQEFEALVERNHKASLKVIIDFVPNHVARQYQSDANPGGITGLGENDKSYTSFDVNNNFYYIPGQVFAPNFSLEVEDSCYYEFPAKATGNNCFSACPEKKDWYETVKLNYGVDFLNGNRCHFNPIPDTWYKMRNILLFWASKGVDGFRCDMAEMVPVDFWGWAIPSVKESYPTIEFIAEVYDPSQYNKYLDEGKFDYLYDKVGLYDTLRDIVSGNRSAYTITRCWQSIGEIQPKMLNFLENHDEQRIASDFFAGDPWKAVPAFVVAATMNTNPVMIYAGQELGERGMDTEGFSGMDGRTSIFDYWSIETLRNRYNKGKIDTDLLTGEQQSLLNFYVKVLTLCNKSVAICEGKFFDLMYVNPAGTRFNPDKQFAWMRCANNEMLLIVVNFDEKDVDVDIFVPSNAFDYFGLNGNHFASAEDLLTGELMPPELKRNSSYPLHLGKQNACIIKFSMEK
jgi:glycosidase